MLDLRASSDVSAIFVRMWSSTASASSNNGRQAKRSRRLRSIPFCHIGRHLSSPAGRPVVHFSTDCVFNGRRGGYEERDPSDAADLYGRSKFLGEMADANALTLRTSMIGRELRGFRSLLDWFSVTTVGRFADIGSHRCPV